MKNSNNLFLVLITFHVKLFFIPLFNVILVKVKPLFNLIPADAKVKLWFMSGGCQKFLDIFLQILPQIRKRRAQGADPGWIKDLTTGKLNSQFAYVDPSDPTYVFVTQPAFVSFIFPLFLFFKLHVFFLVSTFY